MLKRGGCPKTMLSIKDAIEVLDGRWKILILFSLSEGPKRFRQLAKSVHGITDKTLAAELKRLESNQLILRTAYQEFPPAVEYTITEHGLSLEKVLNELHYWGLLHRETVIGKRSKT